MKFVLATANPDKAAEIREILSAGGPQSVGEPGSAGVELLPRPASVGEVEETGSTLAENARLKARALVEATDTPAIADDTGLEVEALGGAPGVYSARYAGEDASYADNVAKLLTEMDGVPVQSRAARFCTVAVALWPDGRELVAEGEVAGTIATAARGDAGFGYDPVFVPDDGGGKTFAEMTPGEKHALSHRGRAFNTLAEALRKVSSGGGIAGT